MFEAMMGLIEDDFVRYVFHLEVVKEEAAAAPVARNIQYSAPEDPVQGSQSMAAAAIAQAQAEGDGAAEADAELLAAAEAPAQQPVRVDKVPGRNEPCWCGSGKKYKLCHGR